MSITNQIDNICLFELEDNEAIVVKKVLHSRSNIDKLVALYTNAIGGSRRALEEIIDLIGIFFKYGDDEIENVVFAT